MSHPADMSARQRDEGLLAQRNGMNSKSASIEPWIGVDELALVLRVSTDWVYEKAAAGELPSYKFGGHRRFRVSEVEDWASRCSSGQAALAGGERIGVTGS
jgi:excisionase family DNA binding protein